MPLLEMSPNIQEADIGGRKRSHDEYVGGSVQIGNEVDAKGLSTTDQPAKGSRTESITFFFNGGADS